MEYLVACKMMNAISDADYDSKKAIELWKTRPLTPEVSQFVASMITDTASLWQIMQNTQSTTFSESGYAGGNAATILRMKGDSFRGLELAESVLVGADLTGADLEDTDLTGADLSQSVLCRTNLMGTVLEGADARESDWLECNLLYYDKSSRAYKFAPRTVRNLRISGARGLNVPAPVHATDARGRRRETEKTLEDWLRERGAVD